MSQIIGQIKSLMTPRRRSRIKGLYYNAKLDSRLVIFDFNIILSLGRMSLLCEVKVQEVVCNHNIIIS